MDPAFNTVYFAMNTRRAPFNNVQAREAVNYAIDRNEAAKLVPNLAAPACQVLPPNVAGYVRYCPYSPDLVKARALVAASGTAGQAVTCRRGRSFDR